ncbi:hypothetical protein NEF87_003303 [Candidatus Lokiarchaeum ossiferum]|uniref:Uncharacterized protein n=1 Tax=Candidatus Lokiarchaeum ossiferum TaxID=2951803 RepID=A0ABY6HU20_9ARCH|nr:hypothetical protein NEF87_003303 [Candidatus Lokiarchaeum sp. B-35]
MKTLNEQIQDILTPNNAIGLINQEKIYELSPLIPVSIYFEMIEDFDDALQQKYLRYLQMEGIVVFNGIIYETSRGLNFQGRLKEILTVYNAHFKRTIGNKKALLKLFDSVTPFEIANLTQDKVIFVMKNFRRSDMKGLVAIRYLPEYEIYYDKKIYQMPPCTLLVHIDENLNYDTPEVIAEDGSNFYEHPFVYADFYKFGQRICMGSFSHSTEQSQIYRLSFANAINSLLKQAVQILVSGYNRDVNPANGHLGTSQYEKFIKSKE